MTKHLQSTLLFAFIIIVATSCSNQKMGKKKPQEKGYIIGTITIIDERPKFSQYAINYKPINAKSNWNNFYNRIAIQSKDVGLKQVLPSDYNIDNKHRFLFFRKVEVGEYDFFNFEFSKSNGMNNVTIRSKTGFSFPFYVKKDSITYVGNITLPSGNDKHRKLINISDNLLIDSVRFCEKYRGIYWDLIENNAAN